MAQKLHEWRDTFGHGCREVDQISQLDAEGSFWDMGMSVSWALHCSFGNSITENPK